MLRSAKDQLASSKTQIAALKKKLEVKKAKALAKKDKEEVEKAKDEVDQYGYDVRVAETEDTLRAEVLAVCRTYCVLTWSEALNQAGVEASSVLRKAESIYYPLAIRPSSFADSKADLVSSEAGEIQDSPPKAPPAANTSSEETEQAEGVTKVGDVNKGVVQGFDLPLTAPKDPSKEKEASQNMELVLATLPIPSKEDLKDKTKVSSTAGNTQPPKDSKEKLVIRMKQ